MVPVWVPSFIESSKLSDETQFIQFGESDETNFNKMNFNQAQPSNSNEWPTEDNPQAAWKMGSIWLEIWPDQTVIERQTYSFLEWLGDIGGLFDALKIIGASIVSPFAAFYLKVELLSQNFRYAPSNPDKA